MKTYYLTLSQVFPSTHPRAGKPTFFRDKLHAALTDNADYWNKLHTIRANYEFWKKRFEQIAAGEACLSIRQWVGKPYGKGSTQREIVRLTREDGIGIQKLRIYEHEPLPVVYADRYTTPVDWQELAANDGLSLNDWREWFKDYDLSQPLAIIHFTPFRY